MTAERRNRRLIVGLLVVVVGMIGLAFASVPLYRAFCEATGYAGTTGRRSVYADRTLDRTITIRFNTDVSRELPWRFYPEQRSIDLKVGETGIVAFKAENRTDKTLTGTALYNVTPDKVGKYFIKVQCFCFGEQVLAPHQSADLPVYFYVDPKIAEDRNLDDVTTITLSYTFFPAGSASLEKAIDRFTGKPQG